MKSVTLIKEKSIKILFVENNLADSKLIYSNISRSNIEFVKEHVYSEKDYVSALKMFVPDIVISDFSMPQFDLMAALLIRNELTPAIPFLIVTHNQNLEVAVECMRLGADDYLIKHDLSRLGEAIKSAINKKEIINQNKVVEENLRVSHEHFRGVALKAEEALKKSEAKFLNWFDLSDVGVAITDPSSGWVEVNDKLSKMLGYSSEEISISTWPQIINTSDLDIDLGNFRQVIFGKIDAYSVDKRFLRKDGETIWISLSVSCVRDLEGQVEYSVALIFDITQRKLMEAELILAKQKAQESDRLKTAFIHNLSHEIRTPLNAILGFGTLLAKPAISPEEQALCIETIKESSDNLLSIIRSIVDISSAEAKVLQKNVISFNLNTALKGLLKKFSIKAPRNSNSLNMKLGLNDEDAFILSDCERLTQIISNLLNNALKFTKNGTVEFGYAAKDTMIEFYVCDSGIGIPSDELNKIFDSFYQGESNFDKSDGAGLGLSICKALVELLGGKIWVSSELAVGSNFYFNIPFDKSDPPLPMKLDKNVGLRMDDSSIILVAEDNDSNFTLISLFLSDLNVTILRAHDGREAVDICKTGKTIDLILMDINMPVMDGYTAIRLIKEIRPEIPIIAQTAYVDDKIEALKLGCVDFIAKPFSMKDFLNKVNVHLLKSKISGTNEMD